MNKWIRLAAVAALTVSTANAAEDTVKSPPMAPARDGDIAIKEELCAARKKGTVAAYDLFIARHPGHPLAEIARKERAGLPAQR